MPGRNPFLRVSSAEVIPLVYALAVIGVGLHVYVNLSSDISSMAALEIMALTFPMSLLVQFLLSSSTLVNVLLFVAGGLVQAFVGWRLLRSLEKREEQPKASRSRAF